MIVLMKYWENKTMMTRSKELKKLKFNDVVDALMGSCYPYGSESIDRDRYITLINKIYVVDTLINEIIEAGK